MQNNQLKMLDQKLKILIRLEEYKKEMIKKPDIDNYIKLYLDVITALKIWDDDSQVINLSASKQYVNDNPATEITIYKI